MGDLANKDKGEFTIVDPDNNDYELAINANGSLNAVASFPEAPVDTTPVTTSAFGDVGSKSGVDTYYTITNGNTLVIQYFLAGAEYDSAGSVVELFDDPNGDLSSLTRISTIFVNAASDDAPVNQSFAGDGTRRIVLRRRTYTGTKREIFGQWQGYEETT